MNREIGFGKGLINSAIWNMLSIFVSAITSFITVPILIKNIGAVNYGLYSIITMIGGVVALQDLGLGEATLRYVAKYYSTKNITSVNRVFGSSVTVCVLTSSVCGIAINIFAPSIITLFKLEPEFISNAILALRIASIGFVFNTIASAYQKIPEAMSRYDLTNKISVIFVVVRSIVLVLLVELGYGIIGLTWVLALSAIMTLLVYWILSKYLIVDLYRWPHLDREGLREVFGYGIFSFLNQLITTVSIYIDRFILGMFFGADVVAYLSVPKDLLTKVSSLPSAAGQALFPEFSHVETDNKKTIQLYIDSTWILLSFSLLLFIPITVLLPSLLSLWISPEFSSHSSICAQLISLNFSLLGVTVPFYAFLKGSGRVHWLTLTIIISSGASAVVAFFLVKNLGLFGAGLRAILMSGSAVIIAIILFKLALRPLGFAKNVLKSIITPILISLAVFVISSLVFSKIDIANWTKLIISYIVIFIIQAFFILGFNVIFYKREGVAYRLLLKAKKRFFTSRVQI